MRSAYFQGFWAHSKAVCRRKLMVPYPYIIFLIGVETMSPGTIQMILDFRDRRNWKQFYYPKDLALSISLEAAELLEMFPGRFLRWRSTALVQRSTQKAFPFHASRPAARRRSGCRRGSDIPKPVSMRPTLPDAGPSPEWELSSPRTCIPIQKVLSDSRRRSAISLPLME